MTNAAPVLDPRDVLPRESGLWVATDTETSGLFPDEGARVSIVSVAWGEDENQAVSFPFDQGPRDKVDQPGLFERDVNLGLEQWRWLLAWLRQQRLIFQNAKFDLHMLRVGTREWEGCELEPAFAWDTKLAQDNLDPLESSSLKPTAERLELTGGGERDSEERLKEELKSIAKRYGLGKRYDLVEWAIIEPYATADADLTRRLWQMQQVRLDQGEGDRRKIDREFELSRVLYRMERRGLPYDVAGSMDAAATIKEMQAELAAQLPFQPSVNAAKRWFFQDPDGPGLVPYEVTEKKREPKLDDVIVRRMIADEVEWAAEYQRWRHLDYANSMWYEGYPKLAGEDSRLRTSFRQGKVVSGRMSVERVQLQAVPHAPVADEVPPVRDLVRASEGRELWEVDLAQAELRVAAKLADCTKMLEMIEEGKDLHGITATQLFDVEPDDEQWFFYRQIAKRGNFSFIFDVGPETFRRMIRKEADFDMPLSQAKRIVYDWKAMYPEFGRAVHKASRIVDRRRKYGDGYVKLVGGYVRWFADYEYTHKAFNQVVQSSLAEFNKDWLIAIEEATGHTESAVLSVHDSVWLDVPTSEAQEQVDTVIRLGGEMGTAFFDVPMEAEAKCMTKDTL